MADPLVQMQLWFRVQDFLFHEARLLDERRFDEWLGLYAPDAEYWVPYSPEQQSPKDHVSLYYETVELLRMRVARLQNELSPLDTPKSRVSHFLSNVTVDEGVELSVRANLLYCEYRREEQRWFAGRASWRLRPQADSFRIAAKRVDLLDADRDGGHLRFAIPF